MRPALVYSSPVHRFTHLTLAALLLVSAACGSSSTTSITGPSSPKCAVTVSNTALAVPASGGTGHVSVEAARECSWSARADASWITLSGTSGQGPATLNYSVTSNDRGTPRRGSVTVSDQRIDVVQDGAPCRYELSPSRSDVGSGPGEVVLNLTATAGCPWTAATDADWTTAPTPATGEGSAAIRLTVTANAGAARTATLTAANATATIVQAAAGVSPSPAPPPAPSPAPTPSPACAFTVSPTTKSTSASGEDVVITVTAPAGCAWTATNGNAWISLPAGAAGTGNGSLRLVVAQNPGAARSGTVTVAGTPVTITQAPAAAACTYSIRPTSYNAGRGPDDVLVQVEAPAGCAWNATSNAAWISVVEGQTGSGNGTVRLSVEANTGAPRSGTVTVAGLTFTVSQNGPLCTNTIDPTSRSVAADGGQVSVSVTAGAGCTWTSVSDVSWITIAQGTSGVGSGTVRLNVEPNTTGAQRTGTVTIAGQTFTVQQEPAITCTYSLKPTWYDAGRGPDDFTVDVRAGSGCAWTATSPVSWAQIVDGAAGTGNGTVRIRVDANLGEARTATITIAGLPFTLRQAAR